MLKSYESKTQTNGITDWREDRRRRALDLSLQGWKQRDISEALGVTQGAVSQWLKRVREEGDEGLRRRKAPGASPRLTPQQRAQIPQLLEQGPEFYGFQGDVWTCGRIADVIHRTFGVSYHPSHVWRILRDCGWSMQRSGQTTRRHTEPVVAPGPAVERQADEPERTLVHAQR